MNRQDGYSVRDIQTMLGASRSLITRMVAAGLLQPWRAERGALRFSFRDVVLIRTALTLRAARVPAGRLIQSLRKLAQSRTDRHLSSVRIAAVGSQMAVREGATHWLVDSGQLVIPFDSPEPRQEPVAVLPAPAAAEQAFQRASAVERDDAAAAEAAYRRAIALAPDHRDACLNLGALLSDQGRHHEAVALYRQALSHHPNDPHLHYNLGVAYEDAGDFREALTSYHRCIALSPDDADAHFNAARLHQSLGEGRLAIRHFNEYRALVKPEH